VQPKPIPAFSHQNNFDLIRLFAAAQVALVHGVHHLGLRLPFHETTFEILKAFPGVPIFFVISGFLISASYDRSKTLTDFFKNRILRIFPALWLCFALSVLMIYVSGYFSTVSISVSQFGIWSVSQLTIVQFYNPAFMRGFGEGVVNGSLWTIPVEMQFYILTPMIFLLYRFRKSFFWVTILLFIIANFILSIGLVADLGGESIRKLFAVTFIPWIYMFMLGFLFYVNWNRIEHFIKGKFLIWLSVYVGFVIINLFFNIGIQGNKIALPWVILIALLVLSAAFTKSHLSDRLLRKNDISYGMYIYHMPVYNFVIYKYGMPSAAIGWLALLSVPLIALVSWKIIERPALSLKKYTLTDAQNLLSRLFQRSSKHQ
jgi:peptidoglycan/LPS O-acetylase OafA/YrhL